ncbi:MAG: cation-translocating P-type ATPase [Prolixibacteraceae bacterium]
MTSDPLTIETHGSATVLCADKTGTLTENNMTVTKLYNGSDFDAIEKSAELLPKFHKIMEFGILSSQTNPFDPMEKAMAKGLPKIQHDFTFEFIGLIGLSDPIRINVKQAVADCYQAGIRVVMITLIVYFIGLRLGYSSEEVRTMTFTTIIISNIPVILTNRSWSNNIFRIIATPNKAVLWVPGGAIFFLLLVLNVPFFLSLFQFQKLSLINMIICSLAGMTTIVWFEIYKLFKQKKSNLCRS